MPKAEKERVVEEIVEQFKKAKGIYLTDFTGLNVEQMTQLRTNFREAGVEYRVVKNSLTRLSATKAGLDNVVDYLIGPTALAIGIDDSVAPARIVADFAKKTEKPKIKVGIVEGELVEGEDIESIIRIPPREVLISQVVGAFSAPISGLVGTLSGVIRNLIGTLEAVRVKKEEN
jgi:large subunit ribosomal protein L10